MKKTANAIPCMHQATATLISNSAVLTVGKDSDDLNKVYACPESKAPTIFSRVKCLGTVLYMFLTHVTFSSHLRRRDPDA